MVQFQRKKSESLFSKVPLTHLLCAALLGIGVLYGAALRRVLFRNEADKVVDFVAFVRIPKTGSTSLWWFLNDYSSMENFRYVQAPRFLSSMLYLVSYGSFLQHSVATTFRALAGRQTGIFG